MLQTHISNADGVLTHFDSSSKDKLYELYEPDEPDRDAQCDSNSKSVV